MQISRAAWGSRRHEARHTRNIATRLGVTEAGLRCLARAATKDDGHALQRGNECTRLERDGLVANTGKASTTTPGVTYSYWTITPAGREIVRQAREMGW